MTTPTEPTEPRPPGGVKLMSPKLAIAGVGAMSMGKIIPHRSAAVRDTWEAAVRMTLFLCGAFSILTTGAIIVVLFSSAWSFFTHPGVSWVQFLTGTEWNPLLGSVKHYGVMPLVIGTLLVSAVAMAVALPGGLITAIYLSEYAPRWLRAILKPVLEVLAGIPTVVYGFFALTIITPSLKDIGLKLDVYNALSAGIAVGIMCLPIVCSLSEDALQAVPRSLREGAYAVGGTRFDVAVRVVMPAALSGIVAAFLLAIARAVGETMIVALAAGSSPASFTNLKEFGSAINPENSTQTMTGYMVQIFQGDASNFGIEYLSSYAVAAMLFVLTFIITLIGHRVRVKYREVYE